MDDKTKKATQYIAIAVIVLGIFMVIFYKVSIQIKAKTKMANEAASGEESGAAKVAVKLEKLEFEGLYSSVEEAVQNDTHRFAFVQVGRKEEPVYSAFVHLEEIGHDSGVDFPCSQVKIQGTEFFLKCDHPELGTISFDATLQKAAAVVVSGKMLWSNGANVRLDKQVRLQLAVSSPQ